MDRKWFIWRVLLGAGGGLVCPDFIKSLASCDTSFDTMLELGLPIIIPRPMPGLDSPDNLPPPEKLGPGVVVWEGKRLDGATCDLYNLDATLWNTVLIPEDINDQLEPYAYSIDYGLIVFKRSAVTPEGYVVFIDERGKVGELVSHDGNDFMFFNWEEHLLSHVFSVHFRVSTHKIYTSPSERSIVAPVREVQHGHEFHPIEVNKDWLKVSWNIGTREPMHGWVKWRRNDTLLTNLFYTP